MRALTLDQAVALINETFAEAKRRDAYPLTAVVLDAGGRLKAAMKQDGASLLRFEVSYGKAYAALAMGRQSRLVLQKAKEKPLFMDSFLELADGPMFLEGGGQLIRDGEVRSSAPSRPPATPTRSTIYALSPAFTPPALRPTTISTRNRCVG